MLEVKKIEELKKGDYFRLVKKDLSMQKVVFVYDGYCRYCRAYCATYFNDISKDRKFKKGTLVTTDFEF